MKKIILSLLVCLCLLLIGSTAGATTEVTGMVVNLDNYKISILFQPESGEDLTIYDLYLSGQCNSGNFETADIVGIEMQGDFLQTNDKIIGKTSIYDITFNYQEFSDCQISRVEKLNYNHLTWQMAAYIGNNQYVTQEMEGAEGLLTNQSSCIRDQVGDLGLLIINQTNQELSTGDQILYGLSIDLTNFEFAFNKISSCAIGQFTAVQSNEAEIISLINAANTIKITDWVLGQEMDIVVEPNCPILQNSDADYGEIIYKSTAQGLAEPLFLSFADENDLATLDIPSLVQNGLCKVISSQVIKAVPIPEETFEEITPTDELTWEDWTEIPAENLYQKPNDFNRLVDISNYYVNKWGKKVYTDRPEALSMIGAIVKGETDPKTYIVDIDGVLRWLETEEVAARLFGPDWDSQITWFSDSIIYTYNFGETITR